MLALAFALAVARPPLMLSTAIGSILPTEPLPLGGYTARKPVPYEPGGDELRAKVIFLRQGKTEVALVTAEMLTIPESLADEVRKRISPGITLFLHATHTHCAPDSQMLNRKMSLDIPGIARFNPTWLEFYARRIAEIIERARSAKAKPIDYLTRKSWEVTANRPRRKLGLPRPEGASLELGDQTIWSYAAHPTFFGSEEMHTREDWPGGLINRNESIFSGAIGDLSPVATGNSASEKIRNLVQSLRATSRQTQGMVEPLDSIQVETEPIELARPTPHPTFAQSYRVSQGLANLVVRQFAPSKAQLVGVRLGSVVLVGIPGEPSGKLGWQIRSAGREFGFSQVWTISHVNGWIGYVLAPEDYDQGGYEATLGFYGREQGDRLVRAAQRLLFKLSR